MVHVTWPRPFQRQFVIIGQALATINLFTKFEVSVSTHYKENGVVSGSYGSLKVTENSAIR